MSINIPAHHYIYGREADPPVELPWPEKYVPRRYMVEAVEHAIASIDAGKRAVIHQPTGSGKTITLARLVQHYRRLGKRCLIIVHRKELIAQIAARLRDFGLDPAVEQGSRRAPKDSLEPVVASVLSLQGRRLKGWDAGAFAVVFTDECHHSEARSYHRIYSHFSGMRAHVGFTATLDRYDKRSLLNTYPDGVLYSYSLLDAVLDGWLCRPKAVRIGIRPDLRECRLLAGDFVASELHAAIHGHLTDLAVATRDEVGSRRTIVFVPTVAGAREFAQKLQILGLRAEAVWGTHPDRDALLTGFRAGDIQVVVNVALLNEGIDVPEIEAVVLLRPTRSRGLYAQMIGRGLRPFPGKDLLLIVDFEWLTRKHQLLMSPTLLLMRDELPGVQAVARGSTNDPVADVRRARATYLHSLEATAYTREEAWLLEVPPDVAHRGDAPPEWLRPTIRQLQTLRSFGVVGGDRMTRVEAGVAIEVAIRRWKRGLANYSSVRALVDKGILPVEDALRCSDLRAKSLLAPP